MAVLVIAAATENNNNCENDYPGAVIIEKMAKAVVIHSMFLRSMFAALHRSFTSYVKSRECVTQKKKLSSEPSKYTESFLIIIQF